MRMMLKVEEGEAQPAGGVQGGPRADTTPSTSESMHITSEPTQEVSPGSSQQDLGHSMAEFAEGQLLDTSMMTPFVEDFEGLSDLVSELKDQVSERKSQLSELRDQLSKLHVALSECEDIERAFKTKVATLDRVCGLYEKAYGIIEAIAKQ